LVFLARGYDIRGGDWEIQPQPFASVVRVSPAVMLRCVAAAQLG
jgi:hypothetical protein